MSENNQFFSKDNYFYKMHGTGNDFIIINGIEKNNIQRQKLVQLSKHLCHRKFGIGADGVLVVRKINNQYKMQVVNSDGSLPNMCGNGLRCFVSLLYHLQLIPNNYTVLTDSGQKFISIQVLSENNLWNYKQYKVTIKMATGGLIQQFKQQKYPQLYFTTVGVPHVVIFLSHQQFDQTDFQKEGKIIQNKYNANINFCKIEKDQSITIKTYQRGAGMTYSCGTGVSSSVYVAVQKAKIKQSYTLVNTDGGKIFIEINKQKDIIMRGPAQIICQGTYKS